MKRKGKQYDSTFVGMLTGNPLKVFALEYPYGTKTC
jgi:hypothetical protein